MTCKSSLTSVPQTKVTKKPTNSKKNLITSINYFCYCSNDTLDKKLKGGEVYFVPENMLVRIQREDRNEALPWSPFLSDWLALKNKALLPKVPAAAFQNKQHQLETKCSNTGSLWGAFHIQIRTVLILNPVGMLLNYISYLFKSWGGYTLIPRHTWGR